MLGKGIYTEKGILVSGQTKTNHPCCQEAKKDLNI